MPRQLYDYCRKGVHRPIKLGDGALIPTDRLTQDFLLCEDCEGVLNNGGERWITGKLATWERSFPLYDLLTSKPPLVVDGDASVYQVAQNPSIDVTKLTHLALGIFWKASVHPWKAGKTSPRIDLGTYSETIRKWLRGEAGFPEHLYLTVIIEPPARAQITLLDPYATKQGADTYCFHIPGILFMLTLGNDVDEGIRALAFNNANNGNPVNISEALTSQFEGMMVEAVMSSRRTKSFLKAKANADIDRRKKS